MTASNNTYLLSEMLVSILGTKKKEKKKSFAPLTTFVNLDYTCISQLVGPIFGLRSCFDGGQFPFFNIYIFIEKMSDCIFSINIYIYGDSTS